MIMKMYAFSFQLSGLLISIKLLYDTFEFRVLYIEFN